MFTDDFKPAPYWWEAAPPDAEFHGTLPQRTDVAIVGAGYAGLSTALELARNGVDVTVLEARELGYGASTRNGGQVSGTNVGKGPSGAGSKSPVELALGRAKFLELVEAAAQSVQLLSDLIRREAIDCDYVHCGRFVGAYTPRHYEAMKYKAEQLNEGGDAGAEMLPRARQREEIATDLYHGGMLVRSSHSVHPARLHKGLREAAVRAGARLLPYTPVDSVERRNGGFALRTPAGELATREVVAGTNGYTGGLTPWLRRRLLPAASYIIATEDLGEERARALIPNMRSISDSKRVLNYFRLSPDGRRVIFGGRAKLAMDDPAATAPILYRQMLRVWPQLEGVRISHAWNGFVAFTFDYLPHMGQMEGVHFLAGCNGSGVAMMNYLGTQTAQKILGQQNRPCPFDGLDMPTRPLYSGFPWFLPAVTGWYRMRDWLDRAGA